MLPRWVRYVPALIGLIAGVSLWPIADASASGPNIKLSASLVKPGATIIILGGGFSRYEDVSVSVCGDGGQEGSEGCDLSNQVTLQTNNRGDLGTALRVEIPPTPCPCAVVIDWADQELTAPISIAGAPTSPLVPTRPIGMPVLTVSGVQLAGSGPWTSWFGGPATRTLVFTLRNSGAGLLASSPIVLDMHSWLTGTVVVKAPDTGILQPGQSRTFHIHVDLGPFAVGPFRINGEIATFPKGATFEASTLSVPVGLVLVALVVVQMVLLATRNLMRRRRERNNPRPPADESEELVTADTEIVSVTPEPV